MNSKRSMWKLLVSVACVGLFATNCTIQTDSDQDNDDTTGCTPGKKKDCSACDNGVTGSQTCQEDGSYGACVCPGSVNGGASNGGASNTAGSSSAGKNSSAGEGGSTPTDGGASSGAGEGGEGGAAPVIDPTDCYGCLFQLCAFEWDHCVAEDEKTPQTPGSYCLSSNGDGSGQIEGVLDCIEAERKNGLVKRDVVRACGSSLGQSTDPSFFLWPPSDMTFVTTQVLNCMADSPTELEPGTWADSTNIPTSGSPKPWVDGTCAKLACTSASN
ncbi:MAG TPA: hypothetical protein VER12_17410 [Polyangiaceae bacterium]|nr:hypothetical protein [Polyangiaceae bacterium]